MHTRCLVLLSILAAAAPARADEPTDTPTAGVANEILTVGRADPRSYASDWLVAPPGWNLGGEMRFITADSAPTGERIKLTDLALLRLGTRWTATRRLELSASADVLAKQLDTTREPLLQGGSLGAKLATSKTVAIAAGVSGGPALGSGWWGDASAGVVHRSRIEDFIAPRRRCGRRAPRSCDARALRRATSARR